MGMEKHTWGRKYCQKAQYAASWLSDEDVMQLAYVADWWRMCLTAKSVFPDGEMWAPNIWNDAVVLVCGTSIRLLIALPEVSWREPGVCVFVFNFAVPDLFQVHEITYQKLCSMQIAPPVVNSRHSHCWPISCWRWAMAFFSDSFWFSQVIESHQNGRWRCSRGRYHQ